MEIDFEKVIATLKEREKYCHKKMAECRQLKSQPWARQSVSDWATTLQVTRNIRMAIEAGLIKE